MARFYADEDFPGPVVEMLRDLGHDVLTAGIVSCTRDKDDLPGLTQRIHDAITAAPNLANQFVRIIRPNPSANP